jgi:hypothetical protein
MQIPRRDARGTRVTINTGLDEQETIWHFRSGWNVAALNCPGQQYETITNAYGAMLQRYQDQLAAANAALDRRFQNEEAERLRTEGLPYRRGEVQRSALLTREAHSTMVYNYFTSPPARAQFCRTALAIANEYLVVPPEDLATFAQTGLSRYEQAFETFYTAYEAYELASTEWDRRYGEDYGASQPGWVAIYGRDAARVPADTMAGEPSPATAGQNLTDPATDSAVPVVPVDETTTATPVVEPVRQDDPQG